MYVSEMYVSEMYVSEILTVPYSTVISGLFHMQFLQIYRIQYDIRRHDADIHI